MQEKFRDKTRDGLTDALNALGLRAEMAERGRVEERVGASWAESLGLIDIEEGPFRWVNVVRQSNQYGSRWWLVFGAPEEGADLRDRPGETKLNTLRTKSFPLLGRITNISWVDNGNDADLSAALSNDPVVKAFVREARRRRDSERRRALPRMDAPFGQAADAVQARLGRPLRDGRAYPRIRRAPALSGAASVRNYASSAPERAASCDCGADCSPFVRGAARRAAFAASILACNFAARALMPLCRSGSAAPAAITDEAAASATRSWPWPAVHWA